MVAVPVVVVVVGRRGEHRRFDVVVRRVGQHSVLHVAAKESFFGEGDRVLNRVVPPAVHPAEEKGSVHLLRHVLVQVELE